jgi:hypothetical protein
LVRLDHGGRSRFDHRWLGRRRLLNGNLLNRLRNDLHRRHRSRHLDVDHLEHIGDNVLNRIGERPRRHEANTGAGCGRSCPAEHTDRADRGTDTALPATLHKSWVSRTRDRQRPEPSDQILVDVERDLHGSKVGQPQGETTI